MGVSCAQFSGVDGRTLSMGPAFGRLRGMSPSDEAAPPTLFEWAGGASAFDALIDRFYDRV